MSHLQPRLLSRRPEGWARRRSLRIQPWLASFVAHPTASATRATGWLPVASRVPWGAQGPVTGIRLAPAARRVRRERRDWRVPAGPPFPSRLGIDRVEIMHGGGLDSLWSAARETPENAPTSDERKGAFDRIDSNDREVSWWGDLVVFGRRRGTGVGPHAACA